VKALFAQYSDAAGKMEGEGIETFYNDLAVDMEDPVTLLISHFMEAKAQGEYSYDEFKKGCAKAKADTL